jgi:hypothetical protein
VLATAYATGWRNISGPVFSASISFRAAIGLAVWTRLAIGRKTIKREDPPPA